MIFIYCLIVLFIFQSVATYIFFRSYKSKNKFGVFIAVLMTFVSLRILLINYIDELTINKSDVKKDLALINISLNNDFEILSNEVNGISERHQTSRLKISKQDVNSIIEKIRNDSNFRKFETAKDIISNRNDAESFERKLILNYKYPEIYVRESYMDVENIPSRIQLLIKENIDTIEYTRFED